MREQTTTFPSFAYTQTIVWLYPNDRAPIRKRSCAYTQFETASKIYFYLWRLVLWICGISVRILLTALDVAPNKIIQSSL